MRKIGLHIDALAAIIFVFLMSFGFNLFQRYQYQDLLNEHTDLQFEMLNLEFGMATKEALLKKCEGDPETVPVTIPE